MNLHQHLLDRYFNPNLYRNIVLDDENQILTVYLNNLSGQFTGFQQYNPNSTDKVTRTRDKARYFSHTTEGSLALWGFETLNPLKRYCFLVEGIFKASMLHVMGYNAIAVLGSSPKAAMGQLLVLPHELIAIGDNDDAGAKFCSQFKLSLQFEKDLDECGFDEVHRAIAQLLERL
ncbi:toprim domain-containing protein [Acinetobacter tibetensis]|uniref:toprim domain-containing protein n=1 Tax=Acinetobacter tibetensis TaxID=2943497 RepID=UPI003A4D7CC9